MLKKLLKFLTGSSDSATAPATSAASGGMRDLEGFVEFVVRSLVDFPDEVRICTEDGNDCCVIKINCRKEDIGKIVGKRGKTIMAIRSLVSGAAGRMRQRVSVEVVD